MFKQLHVCILSLFVCCILPLQAMALDPGEALNDPVLEKRARALSAEIRCAVCQNQSIDDSDAPLAKDLRTLVREKLVEGQTNQQILDHLVARYGEFILLKPRFAIHTLALWVLPLFGILAGLFLVRRFFSTVSKAGLSKADLTRKEKQQLARLLDD